MTSCRRFLPAGLAAVCLLLLWPAPIAEAQECRLERYQRSLSRVVPYRSGYFPGDPASERWAKEGEELEEMPPEEIGAPASRQRELFDAAQEWAEEHPLEHPITGEELEIDVSGLVANGRLERLTILYVDRLGHRHFVQELDPATGEPVGPPRQPPESKAEQKLEQYMPEDPRDRDWDYTYDPEGNVYPSHVVVSGEGASRTELWFNEKGEVWKWSVRDEDGNYTLRGEGPPSSRPRFVDEGPPLERVEPYPEFLRGACAACEEAQVAHNTLAEDLLYLMVEMNHRADQHARRRQLAIEHERATQALGPMRKRYEHLEQERQRLLGELGAAEMALEDCCREHCAPVQALLLGVIPMDEPGDLFTPETIEEALGEGTVGSPPSGPPPSEPPPEPPPPSEPQADLRITKSDSRDPVTPGERFTYTIEVSNDGPDPALLPIVVDRVPVGLRITGVEDPRNVTCSVSGQRVECSIPNLAPGETIQIRVRVAVAPDASPGTVANEVEVATDFEPDPDLGNNSASETTTIQAGEEPPPEPLCALGIQPGNYTGNGGCGCGTSTLSCDDSSEVEISGPGCELECVQRNGSANCGDQNVIFGAPEHQCDIRVEGGQVILECSNPGGGTCQERFQR